MRLRRGFKSEAERISAEIRRELKLDSDQKLNPLKLAEHLAIPVLTMSEVSKMAPSSNFRHFFSSIDRDSFSAVTIFAGRKRVIVHNESHHPNRQASDLSHEVSHTVLEHEPTPVMDSDGQRYWNAEVEDEASWLGAALLIPREAVVEMLKHDWTVAEIAAHFSVSESLCRWRLLQSGADQQVDRWKRYRQ